MIVQKEADVIDFLVSSGALRFGDFTLKSGRKAPYFINTGGFDDGEKVTRLASFYAQHIVSEGLSDVDAVFGPAYKGIPLCVSTAMQLYERHGIPMGFCFNRKEAKTRGEGGQYVGKPLEPGMRIVLVEDVVTAGTTLREVVPVLKNELGVLVEGVVLLVDRDEKGPSGKSATSEAREELGIAVSSIVTIHQIIAYLSKPNSSGFVIDSELSQRIVEYRAEYGVQ